MAQFTNQAQLSYNGSVINSNVAVGETVVPETAPELTITKSIEPVPVTENGTLTYRFIIQNFGNTAAVATDNVTLTDTFDPILSGLTVTLDGTVLSEGTDYTYNETTGEFATVQSRITVPAATYEQDAETGAWIITPGVSTLVITGSI